MRFKQHDKREVIGIKVNGFVFLAVLAIRPSLGNDASNIDDARLRIAAQFFDLSQGTIAFRRAISAFNHPDFYRQVGKEPKELMTAALELLAKRFDLR